MGLTRLAQQFKKNELITVARLPIMKNFFPTSHRVRKMIHPKILDVSNLRMTKEGIYSTTAPDQMQTVLAFMEIHLRRNNLALESMVVTDATANVGGSSIATALRAKYVHAVELNKLNFHALKQNIAAYGPKVFNKITLHLGDYTKLYLNFKQDIVMIDPPWGKGYRNIKPAPVRLYLSHIPVVRIVNALRNNVKMIVLKYPLNFNFTLFRKELHPGFNVYCYKMKFMFLLIITPKKLS